VLLICGDCQGSIRELLARGGFPITRERPLSPVALVLELQHAPLPEPGTFDPELCAYAFVLHRALQERGLDAVLTDACLVGWACTGDRWPAPWQSTEWLIDAVRGVRELAWQTQAPRPAA